ncbi:MAG: aminotransferase class V-fold PLP-dependent enzyme [Chloroflexi bacterium]|nr:aminotransferase class V-fold PLP-dependent enzyme [Chloroflexota bacterium]
MAAKDRVLRAEFPAASQMTYLDVAFHCLLPSSVAQAMADFCQAELQGGVSPYSWKPLVEETREQFAQLIGASSSEIAFVRNTADGLNVVAGSYPWQERDNVVLSELEHPSNVYPWRNLERHGVQIRVVPNRAGRVPVGELIAACDDRTRVVAISAVQWGTGYRADLAILAEYCRSAGIHVAVDAIQALGSISFDVGALGVDFLSCGGHKGLLAPYGIAALYVRRALIPELTPAYLAEEGVEKTGPFSPIRLRDDARRFEIGNPNYVGVAGLRAALRLLDDLDVAAIERHVLDLGSQVHDGLRRRGVEIIGPEAERERSSIVVFRLSEAEGALERFRAEDIRLSLRSGHIRVSFHAYNTAADVDHLLRAVDDHLASL